MDNQEIFDTVVKHLRTQKVQAVNGVGSCQYRTDDGLKCAIGCLLTDSEYSPSMEGCRVSEISLPARLHGNLRLLGELQNVHDHHGDTGGATKWEEALRAVADKFGLLYTLPHS